VLRKALALAKADADGVKELPVSGDDPAHWKPVRGSRCRTGSAE
jgi:hypothetical protein